jgi:glycosyltransferase involved in cell wall biosynthesis
MARIYCTVINDLNYDQRMQRICQSLRKAGHEVMLIGRHLPQSKPLTVQPFEQKRLPCFFTKGKLFYLEYNIRLFFFLLFSSWDVVCGVDLDTILPALWAARLRRRRCVYDAHEYFTEVPEVVHRPRTKAIWERVAGYAIPRVDGAYTVCRSLAEIFQERYGKSFGVVRNLPLRKAAPVMFPSQPPFVVLYQGALNEGRGLETLIQALPLLPEGIQVQLVGEGDCSESLRALAQSLDLQAPRLQFLGYVLPKDLPAITAKAHLGYNVLEHRGLSYYYSLANKFFDYAQSGIPSLNSYFPEYRYHLAEFQAGLMMEELSPEAIAEKILLLYKNQGLYQRLQVQALRAAEVWNWEAEEARLLEMYKDLV